ncbi:MAG: CotH kinase family protein [Burkholderiales bacterium]|nr:CotH kinase family protein [Flavobacterium sp.]
MKKIIAVFFIFVSFFMSHTVQCQGIVINEILTSNTTVNQDEDGTYQDWVELYNAGGIPVNLAGFGLTDDALLPYKWIFPSTTLAAGQYLLVWCSDKNRTNPANPLHTNFKIGAAGEVITLTNAANITVDFVPATVIPQNISYGRLPNGTGNFVFFSDVTPNAVNAAAGYNEVLSPPTFSQDSGFSTAAFNLTLSTTVPGATILYTLDGSEPSNSNLGGTTYSYKNQYPFLPGQTTGPLLTKNFRTLQYSGALAIVDQSGQPNKLASISTTTDYTPSYIPTNPIFKGTVVRAKLIKSGALSSKSVSKTYYVTPLGAARFSLPVVSLSLDENKLFDYNEGINVAGVDFDNWRIANPTAETPTIGNVANFFRNGIENERVANLSYFVNGTEVINQEVGLRIHGGSSRIAQNRSLGIFSRSDYGSSTIDYKFFADKSYDSFSGFVLHNSGNDYNQTLFRDAFCQKLMRPLNVLTKGYQPTITFINGEYWGIMSIRDRLDSDYFKRNYNIASSELDHLENETIIDSGDFVDYHDMINYITNNSLSVAANYDYIKTRLDPENFKDYYISNIFLENTDWPVNNIHYWRKRTAGYIANAPNGQDGRWRWLAHDMDDTFAISNSNINLNSLAAATDPNGPVWPNAPFSTLVLRKLLENNTFKTEFINRFADLINTTYSTNHILETMAGMKAVLNPEAPEQFARWRAPFDNGDWNYFLNNQTNFANQRPDFQRNHIRAQFGITSNINATLDVDDPSHGYIKMNTIDIKLGTDNINANPYPWTGIYFAAIPVTLKAIAYPGFIFSHWTGASTSTNPEITITSATNFNVTAVFVPQTIATSEPIYFWMMNSAIANNVPLQTLNTTFKAGTIDGIIQYQSCLVGYPFTATDVNWRKASMERRNSPTSLNYIPEANNNLPFALSDVKGLQIKEPLQNGNLENTMVLNFSTAGYKDIKLSFAGINELTNANAITVEYSVTAGSPSWTTSGLPATSFPLTAVYQLFSIDFTAITNANDNANFKVRLRFTGTNMTANTGARISFNNIAVYGTQLPLAVVDLAASLFSVFPNPFSEVLHISGMLQKQEVTYRLFTIEGKLLKVGSLENGQVNWSDLTNGMYLLQLVSDGKNETKKIIKK